MTKPIDAERRLVAIFAADVEGYSSLMGADEVGTLRDLTERRTILDALIASHRGRIANTAGDSVLAEFGSAVDAVQCAAEAQAAFARANADLSTDRPISFRIGVHVGDVMVKGGDLFGDGVNIAARLQTLATAGGVCVSAAAYDQVRKILPFAFDDLGTNQVKNMEEPIQAYSVGPLVAPATLAALKDRKPLILPNKPSIAVLPFQNMSGDPEQEYFADGMVEDIITALSRFSSLFVIARNSSFTYKGKAVEIKQVGRELGVRYVLEGSVRRSGNRLRISGQLIEASTGYHLWAERYDRSLDDVFVLQDEIAMSVVGSIEPNLRRAEIERVRRQRPDSLEAYDLFLRALPILYTPMPNETAEAIPMLEKALELDPDYPSARAALAWCFHHRFARGGLREEDRAAAIHHARAATSRGSDDATTLAICGFVIWMDARDDVAALKLFDRALALTSSNIFALACSAVPLAWMGKTDLAIDRAYRALRLSPFDPLNFPANCLNFLANCALAIAYFHIERHVEAADAARSAIELAPRFSFPHAYLAAALVRMGLSDEAKVAGRRVLALQPNFTIRDMSAIVGHEPAVFSGFAEAWLEAGLPA